MNFIDLVEQCINNLVVICQPLQNNERIIIN